MPLGFGLPSPLHDSMRDISLQARRLYALVDSAYTAQNAYLFCAPERLGPVFRGCRRLRQAQSSLQLGTDQFVHLRPNRWLSAELAPNGPQDCWTCYSRSTGICSAWISK